MAKIVLLSLLLGTMGLLAEISPLLQRQRPLDVNAAGERGAPDLRGDSGARLRGER